MDRVGAIAVLSTVHGLVSEADRVRAAFAEVEPAAVALAISPESLAALLRYQPQKDIDPFDDLPDSEYAYSARLSQFGPVDLPPPDLREAADLAKARGATVHGVDLGEEAYEDAFTSEVGWLALLRYGRVTRKLARRPPEAADARAFSLAWDARIRKIGALGRVEARREDAIARGARAVERATEGPVLLILDAPREAGVLAALRSRAEVRTG